MLAALSDGREATSSELRNEIPLLEGSIAYGEGKSWGGQVPIGPRVLTTLSAGGQIVRASNNGGRTTSQPRWTSMESWLGHPLETGSDADGLAALVARWLPTFGPGTATDIKRWIGSAITAVRKALNAIGAVEFDLQGGIGYVLGDDIEPVDPVEPWAALLPPLIRPPWAGSIGTGTSARIRQRCSTPAATPGTRSGRTVGSSAGGVRTLASSRDFLRHCRGAEAATNAGAGANTVARNQVDHDR